MPDEARSVIGGRWTTTHWLAGAVALAFAIPTPVPIRGLSTLNVLGQALAVVAVFVLLPPMFAADIMRRRQGSEIRLLGAVMAGTAICAWMAGGAYAGFRMGSLLSLVNWLAIIAVVGWGQVLFGTTKQLSVILQAWVSVHTLVAATLLVFLLMHFGVDLITGPGRSEPQLAAQSLLPTWPNYFGLALAIAICIVVARIAWGFHTRAMLAQLVVLVATLVVTFSRGAWLFALVGILAVLVDRSLRGSGGRRWLILFTVLAVLASSAIPTVRRQFMATLRPGTSQQVTLVQRAVFAVEAFTVWRSNPLFGIGFRRFDEFADLGRMASISRGSLTGVSALGSVHNEYLSTMLKCGAVGALGFLVFLGGAALVVRRARSAESVEIRWLGATARAIFLVLVVAGLATESFRTLPVSASFWLLVGGLSVVGHGGDRSSRYDGVED